MKSIVRFFKKSLLTRILLVMIVCILVLCILLAFYGVKQMVYLDLSDPYNASMTSDSLGNAIGDTRADGLSAEYCVTRDGITLPDVELYDDTEKALLFNIEDKTALFAQNIYSKAYPASITKLMTAILAMEYADMDATVTMQAEDFDLEDGSQVSGLQEGDKVTMNQLFHVLLVYSANDAALAIAREVAGTVDAFVDMMNEEAQKIGMQHTHFMNPHGLHDDDHYTCAYDVYLMLQNAYQNELFVDTIQMSEYNLEYTKQDGTAASILLSSTDKYLTGVRAVPEGVHIIGGKTGTTDQAGSCLALVVQNDHGVPFISVVLNAWNSTILYDDMDQLLSQINS